MYICVRVKRETGRRTTHGMRAESMWQSAVDTLVMALGRRDEIGDAIRCISADEGCNLARTPFIKAASLPRQIQGYRCCQHQRLKRRAESSNGEPPCSPRNRDGSPGMLPFSFNMILRYFFYFTFCPS